MLKRNQISGDVSLRIPPDEHGDYALHVLAQLLGQIGGTATIPFIDNQVQEPFTVHAESQKNGDLRLSLSEGIRRTG